MMFEKVLIETELVQYTGEKYQFDYVHMYT